MPWLIYIFPAVGLILLVCGVIAAVRTRAFLGKAVSGVGAVTAINSRQQSDDDGTYTVYAPVIEFHTADGRVSTFESNVASRQPEYQVGAQVPILYAPENPQEARIQSWASLWGAPATLSGVGAVFIVVGVVFQFVR